MPSAWRGISLRSIPAGDSSIVCFRQFCMVLKVAELSRLQPRRGLGRLLS
jgi:hypothetical protein